MVLAGITNREERAILSFMGPRALHPVTCTAARRGSTMTAKLTFDRGTLELTAVSPEADGEPLLGVPWDPRTGSCLPPAYRVAEIEHALTRRGIARSALQPSGRPRRQAQAARAATLRATRANAADCLRAD
jgi:hypothetical protein